MKGVISSVLDRDPAALRELERLQLRPGVAVVVDQKNSNASILVRIESETRRVRLSKELAAHISVVGEHQSTS
jgi:hypothetical protein